MEQSCAKELKIQTSGSKIVVKFGRNIQGHARTVFDVVLIENELFTASYDKTIKVWDAESFELKQTLVGHVWAVFCLKSCSNLMDNVLFRVFGYV